jgi:hypothetical protein
MLGVIVVLLMKKTALVLALIAILLFLVVRAHFVNLVEANPYSFFWKYVDPPPGTIPAKITILNPENNTVFWGGDLNIKVHVTGPVIPYSAVFGRLWIRYLLDGDEVDAQYFIHPQSEVDNGTVLHDPSDGNHKLVVEAYCSIEPGDNSVFGVTSYATVLFSVVDVTAPVISGLSIENKTYSQNDLSLYCEVDESTSWRGCSLDGVANVTFVSSKYFSNMASGSHTLTVYANDTSGNMGASEIVFTIAVPSELFPTSLVMASSVIVAVVCVGLGLIVYLIKRK